MIRQKTIYGYILILVVSDFRISMNNSLNSVEIIYKKMMPNVEILCKIKGPPDQPIEEGC